MMSDFLDRGPLLWFVAEHAVNKIPERLSVKSNCLFLGVAGPKCLLLIVNMHLVVVVPSISSLEGRCTRVHDEEDNSQTEYICLLTDIVVSLNFRCLVALGPQ